MLEIINSGNVPAYSCHPQPIVSVTHKFTNDQLEQLLRIAAETLGRDEVQRILGQDEPRGGSTHMVFVEGGNTPRYEHSSYAGARKEAERLAQRTGRTASVLRIVARAFPVIPATTVNVVEY